MLTMEILKKKLSFDPETGFFVWIGGSSNLIGRRAGSKNSEGYMHIEFNRKKYKAHRLAWLYVNGELPGKDVLIDHINGIRDDNRICNLRLATNAQNIASSKRYSKNTSGYKGVYWDKYLGKWRARIGINWKQKSLGLFNNPEDAYAAYCKAAKEIHGDFSINLI